jgi:hypothetical protein
MAEMGITADLTTRAEEQMDTGIWITWYDLPEDGREAYLTWAHQTYIPKLLERPGVLWAAHYATVDKTARRTNARDSRATIDDPAVPRGEKYMLIAGAECADVFGRPIPSKFHAELPAESREMIAMRIGERINIMAEAGRVEGPEMAAYGGGMALAPCVQVGNYNTPWQDEAEMLSFYSEWRMPKMGRTPGCIRIRKLASVAGWAKHGVLYEFPSLEARNEHFIGHEDAYPDMKTWGDTVTRKLVHAPGSSTLATRIWPVI